MAFQRIEFFVGNTMIDTLLKHRSNFKRPLIWEQIGLQKEFIIMTLHRPSNVDEGSILKKLICAIIENSNNIPIIFPIAPKNSKKIRLIGDFFPKPIYN